MALFDPFGKFTKRFLILGGGKTPVNYLFRDDFVDTLAAGSVNGTPSTPGPGTRASADTENKLSVDGSQMVISGGKASPGFGDPSYWGSAVPYQRGLTMATRMQMGTYNKNQEIGLDENNSGGISNRLWFAGQDFYPRVGAGFTRVGDWTYHAWYNLFYTIGTGAIFFYVYGGTSYGSYPGVYAEPTLVWWEPITPVANYYPAVQNNAAVLNVDAVDMFVADVPVPVASDSFDRSDGAIGNTDGAGCTEPGGGGVVWDQKVGTWEVSTNAAIGTPDGGLAIATACNVTHAVISTNITRSGGNAGIVCCYVDADNYVVIYHDGTNVVMDKIVGGTLTNVSSTAAAYSAGAKLLVAVDNGVDKTNFVITYNKVFVGTYRNVQDTVFLGTCFESGLYTTDAGNTFDNFVAFRRGANGEYSKLNRSLSSKPARVDFLPIGDSKTALLTCYPSMLATRDTDFREWPPRSALSGGSVAQAAIFVDAYLLQAGGNPTFCLCNLGANDVVSLPAEATWKADYLHVFDAVHTKWPDCQIYVMRPWRRGYATECDTLATWITDMVALRSFVHPGPDERVFIENGDDGVTYTSDGVHPNEAGQQLTAAQWRSVLGY